MKLKSLLFVGLIAFFSSANAENSHRAVYPAKPDVKTAVKKAKMPGYCEVQIINKSSYSLTASGQVVSPYGGIVNEFYIGPASWGYYESHIIDLYDYDAYYCPQGINLLITTNGWFSKVVFKNFVSSSYPYPIEIVN
ncbi:hypothetical protein BN59_01710 [Legionella massiliensis]|uniref:Uncharacterized protein n=1 Tax=Legionella massiliensis TaxID=1034943 RepID=A0A078KWS1_9GAMM|nr:hypothetical protein [Legionella massiliensis]CDZ77427.1 hypothetical protein BN59_01710 [Legionella massiliensis]CEE13165.1 hypothetical protein BN1094_01710 [Legionella massiliensis]